MKVGLLWFDDDPHTDLSEKIARAAARHRQKFSTQPNVCYVHKSLSNNGKIAKVGQIRVKTSPSVLLHHLWIGQEEKQP